MVRRVRRPEEQEEMYRELVNTNEPGGIFTTFKEVFMLAGVVGFMNQKRMEFSDVAEGIPWSVFNPDIDGVIIEVIALATTKDITNVSSAPEEFEEKLSVFEEYAAGGFTYVYQKIMDNPRFGRDIFFDFIKSMQGNVTIHEKNMKEVTDLLF